uniref:Interleukin-12 subunit beta n=1 Tax=Apteryx owenii TaxID=8824 RepID=A0A8B9PK72_APTOW
MPPTWWSGARVCGAGWARGQSPARSRCGRPGAEGVGLGMDAGAGDGCEVMEQVLGMDVRLWSRSWGWMWGDGARMGMDAGAGDGCEVMEQVLGMDVGRWSKVGCGYRGWVWMWGDRAGLGMDVGQTLSPGCATLPGLGALIFYPLPAPPGQEEGMNVSCQAESYRGSFRCSWRAPSFAVFRARLTRSNGSFGDWVHVAGHRGRFNANFTDPSFCPFAEELHPLQLHLEGLSDTSFLSFTVHFFIRDIVQPDPPQELTVRRRGDRLYLSWAPPASWPLPKSYFALFYRLQYELLNGTQVTLRVAPCPRHPVPSLPRALAAPCLHGPVPVLPCACVALCPHSPVPLLPLPCPLHALCPCCPVLSLPHARTAPCLCCSVPTLHCLHSYLGLFFLLS